MTEVLVIDTFSCSKRKSGLEFSLFCFTDILLGIVLRANNTNLDNMDSAQESFILSSSEGRQKQLSVSEGVVKKWVEKGHIVELEGIWVDEPIDTDGKN